MFGWVPSAVEPSEPTPPHLRLQLTARGGGRWNVFH